MSISNRYDEEEALSGGSRLEALGDGTENAVADSAQSHGPEAKTGIDGVVAELLSVVVLVADFDTPGMDFI